ncbi:23S rRNA pseudouridine(1911/1915/1917) synthase RluD [Kingella kingae]|uniref:23S rRNA pseudouridine(1911/1915/1917) synthase RluD n=1 Tax=Kingella kingae TaxID=504 RepID=UPI0002585FE0|nr:23S rRNA pseudouridine(1911/1915/1917) synthase RluD [Kingella kingae]EIC13697.1 ribosomal large subunit pseudouridine synthase D [Kingella kingae PYKK081]MDK4568473.1 23S rRNA pseudouridine(1911/1915/1917) synthase RluD [Kingella kingae]MDK4570410.1 23S rRNA pseudouridine(1911/1915/1917) synthase RluD [Kingella kingae]MDK4572363.1 23S rRNA pseudouridine(1911/1915/1917) synthase RluD [Kingella kingae]MDK4583777.1 23S rRNA pseudouridine(1911/1915/1917) synthase RluD [Kingella kingae]
MDNIPFENGGDYNDDLDFVADQNAQSAINLIVPNDLAGMRLDAALAKLLPDYSRSRITTWIKDGFVQCNGKTASPKEKLIGGEKLSVKIQQSDENQAYEPEHIDLNIVFEDDTVIVLNKPAGLVVHPAAGNWTGTLLNGLLAHCPELSQVPRAGIVHRLDKDTSGLMVVAKTLPAQNSLVQQLQNRTVKRIYRAVADGIVPFDGKIETLIGRDPHNRLKMAVVKFGGKEAVTHVKVLERYHAHSYIECSLETGRTHQIRVHMKEARHPLAGDPVYGNPRHVCSQPVKDVVKSLARQALHAYRLSFVHPKSGELVSFEAPMPDDMYHLLSVLRLESGLHSSLSKETEWSNTFDDDDDWNEDDYDVQVVYVKD